MTLPPNPKIVFLDRETLAPAIRLRPPAFPHRWEEHQRTAPDQVLERLRGAGVAVINKVQLREPVLAQLPDLRLIAVAATGTDCVDTAWCGRNGVAVCNIRGYAVHTVPEHVFTLILSLRRSLLPYRRSVEAGRWQEARQFCFFDHPILDLHGARLGLIGGGSLGSAVATIGRAFGMDVVFAGRKGDAAPADGRLAFDEVIATSDVISLHCPLRPETRGLIGTAEFARMKPEALLINTARGGLVDEDALTEALRGGRIGGAGFDVAMPEPPPADAPLMRLLDLPNFILTPHVAWAGRGAMQALADQLIDLIDAFEQGRPFNLVAGGPKG
ncbi:D-2-hydroxyacid dehydrogenase [Inquilinus sp.]|uniref:D-2-hydroxyacid dehydrogenase n=1 Tax=Inquilinus sp. TaxID=1932117 RepID=UPI0031DDCEBD